LSDTETAMTKIYLCFIIIISLNVQAQKLDSLETLATKKDTTAVRALNQLYRHYLDSNPKKALNYTLNALDLAIKLDYKKGEASCYNNIGVFYKNQGVLDKAVNYYLKSLSINEKLNNAEGKAFTYNNIGTIYSMKKDYNNALKYFLNSYNLLDSLGNEKAMIGALNNLGNTYLAKEEDYRAIGFYKRALRVYEDNKGETDFDPYANIGHAYFLHGELNRSLSYYERSLENNKNMGNINGQAYAYHNMAIIYQTRNNSAKALALDKKALNAAEQVLNKALLRDIHRNLADIYDRLGKMELAYKHLQLFISFQELLLNEENSDKLAQMETTYLLMEKDKQLALISKENELNKLKANNTKTIIITSIMGTMLVLAALFVLYTIRRQRAERLKLVSKATKPGYRQDEILSKE
jgi:tetratricopeptide (TPR) repeat protein